MYARVAQVQLQSGRGEEGVRTWQETLLPRLKQQPGFKGLVLMRDEANRGMNITFWESEEQARVMDSGSFAEEMRAAVQQNWVSGTQLQLSGYQVMLHEDV